LVFPARISNSIDSFVAVAREELAAPLPAVVDELREYFGHLVSRAKSQTRGCDPRFRELQETFAAPRFRLLYRRCLTDGETAFETVTSPVIAEAIACGARTDPNGPLCRLGTTISPLWRLVRPEPTGVEEGDEAGDKAAPPRAPHPTYSISDPDEQ